MKIAFYVYPTAFQSPGGGEILLLKTKEALEREGVSVTLLDPWRDELTSFDILHTFGSVKDSLPMMEVAHNRGVRNVLSTVCWYSWKSAWGIYPEWQRRIPAVMRHFAKVAFPWVPSARKRMMEISDVLIPNSKSESDQLRQFFGMPQDKIRIIYNAVDDSFADATPELFLKEFGIENFVLCVGRIEPRKNQLNVIRALQGTGIPLVFVGDPVHGYEDYFNQCRAEAESNVHFLGGLPHDSDLLKSAYAACNTFLLATWLETPGLSALEAGLAGAKVVVTAEGATEEYFSSLVSYVQPDDTQDIRMKTLAAYRGQSNKELSQHIQKHYNWQQVARDNIKVYEELLNRDRKRKVQVNNV